MRNFKLLALTVTALLAIGATACGGMQDIAGGVGEIAGVEMPKTEEVELTAKDGCTECKEATLSVINPEAPVKYTKVGIAEIDGFVESANKLYLTSLLAEKVITAGKGAADGEKINGFESKEELESLSKTLLESVTKDAPGLITQGQAIAGNAAGLAADPKNAMVAPTAVEQIKIAIERLNEAQSKVTGLGSADAAAPEAAPAAE
jgi:hypothetical protein